MKTSWGISTKPGQEMARQSGAKWLDPGNTLETDLKDGGGKQERSRNLLHSFYPEQQKERSIDVN